MANWRRTKDYRLWRVFVIRRDKICRCCGSKDKREAHHIEDGSHNANLRFDVDNGITLCRRCHSQFHTNFKNSYREKTNRKDLNNFFALADYFKKLNEVEMFTKGVQLEQGQTILIKG